MLGRLHCLSAFISSHTGESGAAVASMITVSIAFRHSSHLTLYGCLGYCSRWSGGSPLPFGIHLISHLLGKEKSPRFLAPPVSIAFRHSSHLTLARPVTLPFNVANVSIAFRHSSHLTLRCEWSTRSLL